MYSIRKIPNPSPVPITSHDSFGRTRTGVNSVSFVTIYMGAIFGKTLPTLKGTKLPNLAKNVIFENVHFGFLHVISLP